MVKKKKKGLNINKIINYPHKSVSEDDCIAEMIKRMEQLAAKQLAQLCKQ